MRIDRRLLQLAFGGLFWRYRYDQFGWTTRSSQLYESTLLRIASPLFHFGLLQLRSDSPRQVVAHGVGAEQFAHLRVLRRLQAALDQRCALLAEQTDAGHGKHGFEGGGLSWGGQYGGGQKGAAKDQGAHG